MTCDDDFQRERAISSAIRGAEAIAGQRFCSDRFSMNPPSDDDLDERYLFTASMCYTIFSDGDSHNYCLYQLGMLPQLILEASRD
ncbi:hypothetical protein EJB05_53982 [Eragrostis curvula]|uniref:Uncharacterized protein n=1 Tax=Eragrostis curvula TaxID=38414 RepID=A0A5J9SNN8_9POAL|nr:hypothetical protein EJB05_53982 [Eragrostis curvula]